MKYQALYDYVSNMDAQYLIFDKEKYPENIVIPAAGYAVPLSTLSVGTDEKSFDASVDFMMEKVAGTYAYIQRMKHPVKEDAFDYYFGPAMVFNTKDYAMGFTHGFNHNTVYGKQSIIDLITGEIIRRK